MYPQVQNLGAYQYQLYGNQPSYAGYGYQFAYPYQVTYMNSSVYQNKQQN